MGGKLNNCDLWSLGPPPPRAGGPVPLGTRRPGFSRLNFSPGRPVKHPNGCGSCAARPPIPGGNATEDRTHGLLRLAGRSHGGRRPSCGHHHSPQDSMTTSCTHCRRRRAVPQTHCSFLRRGSPGVPPFARKIWEKLGGSIPQYRVRPIFVRFARWACRALKNRCRPRQAWQNTL